MMDRPRQPLNGLALLFLGACVLALLLLGYALGYSVGHEAGRSQTVSGKR